MTSKPFEILPTKNIAKKYSELTNSFLLECFYEEKSFICCFIRDLSFINICNAINEIISDEENDFYKLKISIFNSLTDYYKHFQLINIDCKNNVVVVEYSIAGIYSDCDKITFVINNIDQFILKTNGKENEFAKYLIHYFD